MGELLEHGLPEALDPDRVKIVLIEDSQGLLLGWNFEEGDRTIPPKDFLDEAHKAGLDHLLQRGVDGKKFREKHPHETQPWRCFSKGEFFEKLSEYLTFRPCDGSLWGAATHSLEEIRKSFFRERRK